MNNETITSIWQSEETMEAAYTDLLHLTKLDRTKDASKLVRKLMEKLVGPNATYHDIHQWVGVNVFDFNLSTQILLNAQQGSIKFRMDELERAVNQYQKDGVLVWTGAGDSPFEKKAKFKEGDDEATRQYNRVLANARNLKILTEAPVGFNSFRISPIGSTPAFADLGNLSSLSIVGLRDYLTATVRVWTLNHEKISKRIDLHQQEDGGYVAEGLDFPVYSKSGGDIVTRALTSRWMAWHVFANSTKTYVVPKYDSLLTVGPFPEYLEEFADEFEG